MPASWIPYLGLGLSVAQIGQGQRYAQESLRGLSEEEKTRLRKSGTSNIAAQLSERGLLDSSLFAGGLAGLERQIAETRDPNADLLWQMAMGAGQSGQQGIANLAQLYMLRQIYGQGGGFGDIFKPWNWNQSRGTSPPFTSGGDPGPWSWPWNWNQSPQ